MLTYRGGGINLSVLKTAPSYESREVNAALVLQILLDFNAEKDYGPDLHICDGERNILHQTAFQEYLIKYFSFWKAYCKLHLIYRRRYKPIVKIAYRARKILQKMDGIGIVHKLNGILKMEQIVRGQDI